MTPHEFVSKWSGTPLTERAAAQSHFLDLCRLLGVETPTDADRSGEDYAFEKGAVKSSGGDGWADVFRRGCFAWEYKKRKRDLNAAYDQLVRYAPALGNPPLLIVSDMDRIAVYTNWTNTVQQKTELALEDLLDGAKRQVLRDCFTHPDRLKPGLTRAVLTESAAKEFAALAQRLRDRGHEGQKVAHFVIRLAFCLFAEDAGLLPENIFTRLLEVSRKSSSKFRANAGELFRAMSAPDGRIGFTEIPWFNGGVFDDAPALDLEKEEIEGLLNAARLDWSQIDPAILGTLFERGLDPDKRSQLGAHYTDAQKVGQIIDPVLKDPLLQEWAGIKEDIKTALQKKARKKAEGIYRDFLTRLRNFRVLDPACGSGNFLYVALKALKDIEHLVRLEGGELLGLAGEMPEVGPENCHGIEINAYAAELARASLWIGELQWMRAKGFGHSTPILKKLDNIENRDAVLDATTGERSQWPEANVIVGNPPFLGKSKLLSGLGEDYVQALRQAWPEVPAGADLVCYWFAAAWEKISSGKTERAGLVATNSIRHGKNRRVLDPIVVDGRIFEAWSDEPWTVEGAAVRVSLVCFDRAHGKGGVLDGRESGGIYASLTGGAEIVDLTKAARLGENTGTAFEGVSRYGAFDVSGEEARRLLLMPLNPNDRPNADVVKPWRNGMDVVRRPLDKWIIDFGLDMPEKQACLYEAPFKIVEERVKSDRIKKNYSKMRDFWWLHWCSRPEMRQALKPLSRFMVTPRVAKHRIFRWTDKSVLPDTALVVVSRDDDAAFGILSSKFHELWALNMGSSLEDRPRYTPTTTFQTFPFPEGLTPDLPASEWEKNPHCAPIAGAARALDSLRENWLNPANLVRTEPEVVPGFPDRILPVNEEAAARLKTRTLTSLYNERPAWLENTHKALDEAVAGAYGWGEDYRAGRLTDNEILRRLLELNQSRAGWDAAGSRGKFRRN